MGPQVAALLALDDAEVSETFLPSPSSVLSLFPIVPPSLPLYIPSVRPPCLPLLFLPPPFQIPISTCFDAVFTMTKAASRCCDEAVHAQSSLVHPPT